LKISSAAKSIKNHLSYLRWFNLINSSQWWNKELHEKYQWKSLIQILNYAYNKIPYYKELFTEIDATPNDFKSFDDFAQFPFLTKEIIRERLDDMIPVNVNRDKLILYNTGGSTGEPLSFYKTKRDDVIERAFMFSQWSRVGFHRNDSRVIIRGEVLRDKKLWEKNKNSNVWKFSAYQLSAHNIEKMVEKINEIKPAFFHVYPTSMQIFTQLMKEQKLNLNFSPKAILCGSEKLYDYQRNLFEDFFGCRVFSWLGLAEQTILAGECEYSEKLHIFSEHSYVELIDDHNKIIHEPGISGEIVGTRLHRFIIPFIRYRSGDIASYADGPCKCKRNYKLLDNVEGRVQDIVVTKQGKKIPVTALFFGQHLKVFEKALKIQLVQQVAGEVTIKIVRGKNYSSEDEVQLLNKLSIATSSEIKFKLNYVDHIETTKRGKHKFLISEIN